MVWLLWDESDYEQHLIGVFQSAQEAFDNRTECWSITRQPFGMLASGYGQQMWASFDDSDGRSHLAKVKSDGDFGYAMVGIHRVVEILSA